MKKYMIQWFLALLGGRDENAQVLLEHLLADKLCQPPWTQRVFQGIIFFFSYRFNQSIIIHVLSTLAAASTQTLIRDHSQRVSKKRPAWSPRQTPDREWSGTGAGVHKAFSTGFRHTPE
jgi:hypothetical protein